MGGRQDSRGRPDVDLSSQFLPESLPEGDPVHYALPIFLEEPVSHVMRALLDNVNFI